MQKFIDQIVSNLESNGFPDKKVSLPTEKMYEIADSKALSFNTVLDEMKSKLNIMSEIGAETIVFTKTAEVSNPFDGMDMGDMGSMDQASMFAKAQEMMSKMRPEDLKKMQDTIMNMSPEEKEELMKKGKDMGLV